jgi:hypothetical protein
MLQGISANRSVGKLAHRDSGIRIDQGPPADGIDDQLVELMLCSEEATTEKVDLSVDGRSWDHFRRKTAAKGSARP